MSLMKTINYNDPGNFSFNSDLVEITTRAALKDRIDSDELFFGNFATKDLLRSVGGSLIGTLGGGAVVGGGLLNFPNVGGSWGINPSGMLTGDSNICTIRFKVTPNYTGNPATDQYFYEEKLNSGGSRIWIYHNTSGSLNVEFRNSANAGQGTLTGAWSPVAGTEYEFELNVNTTTGVQEYYIDGVLVASRTGFTFTRDNSTINYLQVGFNSINQNFAMDDLQRFSVVKHTENFASEIPRFVPTAPYTNTAQIIAELGAIEVDGINSFSAVTNEPSNTEVKFFLDIDNTCIWWNGSAWVPSNCTLLEANTAAEINANIGTLDVSQGVLFRVKAIIDTDNKISTPELFSVTVEYNFYSSVVSPNRCVVYGYVFDGLNVVQGATVDFASEEFVDETGNFISINEQTTTNAQGYFEIILPSTIRTGKADVNVDVAISFVDARQATQFQEYTAVIPNQASASLESIVA